MNSWTTLKNWFVFYPEHYYDQSLAALVSKPQFLADFKQHLYQEEIKSELVARYFIFSCFLFGLAIAYKYQTYSLAIVGGGLGVALYFLGLKLIPHTYAQRLLNECILQWFILQYITQMHGMYEMHFTYFPITSMMIVYRDLGALLISGMIPVAQHLLFFTLQLAYGYDLREYFINLDLITVELMIYHLGVATLHLVVVGFFCVFFRDKIAFQYQTYLKTQYMADHLRLANENLEDKVRVRTLDLAEKNAQLVRLNQEKNEFLGIAAHDLKNPLSAIKGFAEEIEEAYDDLSRDEAIEYAQKIHQASEKMFGLITNLLDVNAIESGKMNIEVKAVDVHPIVSNLARHYAQAAEAKGISLYFNAQYDTCVAYVDENTTHQILDNLISNAVKYSPACKQIEVRLLCAADGVRCEIQDQGPGLSDADKQKLFGKFNRLSAKPTGGEHSTGLGLFIVKKLVEAMRGEVWCESELGRGATFIVRLPGASPQTEKSQL